MKGENYDRKNRTHQRHQVLRDSQSRKIRGQQLHLLIEKIYVKKLKRFEIRFSLYKDLTGHPEKYIARSLDVTELEFISLLKDAIEKNVFTSEMIEEMSKLLSSSKKNSLPKSPKSKEHKPTQNIPASIESKNAQKEIA